MLCVQPATHPILPCRTLTRYVITAHMYVSHFRSACLMRVDRRVQEGVASFVEKRPPNFEGYSEDNELIKIMRQQRAVNRNRL